MPVIQKEQISPCEVSLEIEVLQDQVSKAIDEAYKEVGKTVAVPGFRKGKAPRAILERHLDEGRVLEKAAENMVEPAFKQAIEEEGIEPFGDAEYEVVEIASDGPFKFKAKVPLRPTIELGQYVGIEVDRLAQQVSDEDVEKEIESIRQRYAKVENIEGRSVQKGDLVIIEINEPGEEPRETVVEAGGNFDSFDDGIIGMEAGETRVIDVKHPDDDEIEQMRGKTSHVTVMVKDIKGRQVPELTDEFVKEITEKSEEKLESVEQLRNKIKTALETASSETANRKAESEIVEKVVEASTVCFPEMMLDHEVGHRARDLMSELESRKMTLEDYLQMTGKTAEQLQSDLERSAERDLRASLVLAEVANAEKLEVAEVEVEAEVEKMAESSKMPIESIKAYLDKTGGRSSIKNRLKTRKVLDFLVHASNIKSVGRSAS